MQDYKQRQSQYASEEAALIERSGGIVLNKVERTPEQEAAAQAAREQYARDNEAKRLIYKLCRENGISIHTAQHFSFQREALDNPEAFIANHLGQQ